MEYGSDKSLDALLTEPKGSSSPSYGSDHDLDYLINPPKAGDSKVASTPEFPKPDLTKMPERGFDTDEESMRKMKAARLGVLDFASSIAGLGMDLTKKGLGPLGKLTGLTDKVDNVKQELGEEYKKSLNEYKESDPSLGEQAARFVGSSAVLGPATKGIGAIGGLARGINTLGKIGQGALTGSATGALAGATMSTEENPMDINPMGAVIGAGLGAGLGGAMGGLGSYIGKASNLAQAKAEAWAAKVLNRDVNQTSGKMTRNVLDRILDRIPLLGTGRARVAQARSFKEAIARMIKNLSKKIDPSDLSPEAVEASAKKVTQKAADQITKQEQLLYKPIDDLNKKSTIKLSKETNADISGRSKGFLDQWGKTLPRKYGDLKDKIDDVANNGLKDWNALHNYKSTVGSYLNDIKKDTHVAKPAKEAMYNYYKDMYKGLQKSLPEDLQEPFIRAHNFTARKHQLFDSTGFDVEDMVKDQGYAKTWLSHLLKEKSPAKVRQSTSLFKGEDLQEVRAQAVMDAFAQSTDDVGRFNVGKFLKLTGEKTNTRALLGDSYHMLTGLQKVMRANQASRTIGADKWPGTGLATQAAAGTIGGAGVAAGLYAAPWLTGGLLSTVALLGRLSAHSPVKTALAKLGLASPGSKLNEYLIKNASKELAKVGVILKKQADGNILMDVGKRLINMVKPPSREERNQRKEQY